MVGYWYFVANSFHDMNEQTTHNSVQHNLVDREIYVENGKFYVDDEWGDQAQSELRECGDYCLTRVNASDKWIMNKNHEDVMMMMFWNDEDTIISQMSFKRDKEMRDL